MPPRFYKTTNNICSILRYLVISDRVLYIHIKCKIRTFGTDPSRNLRNRCTFACLNDDFLHPGNFFTFLLLKKSSVSRT
ncbi:hypothetical protein Hanom_Chr14g01305941 [Helianthus anomalus]